MFAGPVAADDGQGRAVRAGAARRRRGARHRPAAGARAGAAAAARTASCRDPGASDTDAPSRLTRYPGRSWARRVSLLHRLTASAADASTPSSCRTSVEERSLHRGLRPEPRQARSQVVGRLRRSSTRPARPCRRSRPSCSTARLRSSWSGWAAAASPGSSPAAGSWPGPGRRARRPAGDLQPLVRAAARRRDHATAHPSDRVTTAEPRRRGGRTEAVDLRETYRKQMLDSIGGWQGTLITADPDRRLRRSSTSPTHAALGDHRRGRHAPWC